MDPIFLRVSETEGRARVQAPVTRGVPLPQGALHDPEALCLQDAAGRSLPAQWRVLGRWPDGSLQWVLLDTILDVPAGGLSGLQVTSGTPASPTSQLRVTPDGSALLVDTGRLSFVVNGKAGLLGDVQLDGRSVPSASDAGLDAWAEIIENEQLGGTQRRIYGPARQCKASLAQADWQVDVEESGPLRTVILVRGGLEAYAPMHHYAGYQPLQFALRIHVWAGQPFVRLQHSVVMSLDPRQTKVAAFGLSLPAPEDQFTAHTAADAGRAVELRDSADLRLWQRTADRYELIEHTADGQTVSEGERTDGWLSAECAAGGVVVGLPHMAEQFPQQLRASAKDALVEARLWAAPPDEPLNLARYADEVAWHEGEGIFADGTGTAVTGDVWLAWFGAEARAAGVAQLIDRLQPAQLHVEPQHVAAAEVLGGLTPSGQDAASDELQGGFVDWLDRQIQAGKWFGLFNWGDALVDWDEAAGTWRFTGRWGWCNSEWDPRHPMWVQYARTADPRLLELACAMTRHSVDVDVCHWHPVRPYFVGGGFRHSVDHYGDEPTASHTFVDGWIDHYWMTGDLRTLQVLREAGEFFLRYRWTEDPSISFSLRSIANVLRGLLHVYRATDDERLLRRAEQVYDVIARGQNDDGSWHKRFQVSTDDRLPRQLPYNMATEGTTLAVELGAAEPFNDEEHRTLQGDDRPIRQSVPPTDQKGYQTHYLMIGLELMHRMTGRDDVAQVYLRAVDWFCGGVGQADVAFATSQTYGGVLCRHLAYASRLTGEPRYLELGQALLQDLLDRQDRSDNDFKRGSVGMSPMYLSLLFFGVPPLLARLHEVSESDE